MDLLLVLQAASFVASLPAAISSLIDLVNRGESQSNLDTSISSVEQGAGQLRSVLEFLRFIKETHDRFTKLTTEVDKFVLSCRPGSLSEDAWEALKLSWLNPLQPVSVEYRRLETQVWSVLDTLTIDQGSTSKRIAESRVRSSLEALKTLRDTWPDAYVTCKEHLEQSFSSNSVTKAHNAFRELLSQTKRALDESNAVLINYIDLLTFSGVTHE